MVSGGVVISQDEIVAARVGESETLTNLSETGEAIERAIKRIDETPIARMTGGGRRVETMIGGTKQENDRHS